MTPLEHALVALGRELELPPAPDLVPAVRARLEPRRSRRSAGRRAGLALRAANDDVSGDAAPSPEASLLAVEDRTRLLDAVNDLPEDARLVVSCRYFLGLSEEETARALGVRVGTVKSRTARALDRLRETL